MTPIFIAIGRFCRSQYRSQGRGWSYVVGIGLLVGVVQVMPLMTASVVLAQTVPMAIRQAYTLLDQGLVNQAIAQFEQSLRQFPQSTEGWLGLAIAYRRAGRDADAFRSYERVLEFDANNRLALSAIGVLGGFRPEWQNRGLEALTRLLSLDTNDIDARAQRALLYVYQGRFSDAISDYEQVLQRNPTPAVIIGAAQAYTYAGDYPRGLELFRRYESAGGTFNASEAIAYALALRESGRADQAVQILESQLRRTPELTRTTINLRGALASSYAARGQWNQAIQVLAPLRGRQDSRMVAARAFNDLGRYSGDPAYYETAANLYRQVLTQTPDLTAGLAREIANTLSGMPLRSEQQYALEVYRQLGAQYPGDRSLITRQVVLERQLGLLSSTELLQRLQQVMQPFPSDRGEQREIAQALIRLDPPDPALLPIYQMLLSQGVNEPFINIRMAQIYSRQGNQSAAQNALATYASMSAGQQDQATILLLQAKLDRQSGNLEASAQRYQSLIASQPAADVLTGALQGLASVRQQQGRVREAIALYDQIIALNPQDPAKPLGRAALAYQAGLISESQAQATLNNWLANHSPDGAPPELFSLVGILPADPQRERLYITLSELDPSNVPVQLRRLQQVARQNPGLARAQLNRLVAENPNDFAVYFVQGELAQDLNDLDLASEAYELILSQQPTNTGALLALGGVRFQQRQYDAAAQLYNEAIALEPENPVAVQALVSLTVVQGRRLEALRQLEQLQVEQSAAGLSTEEISRQMQEIREGYLQQRGFQPPWERF
jgi:tetratricopeptide (TPR) repeat protein